MFFIAIIPWGFALLIWGVVACLFFVVAAMALVLGIILLPFRLGLGVVNLALQIFLFPLSMLTGRAWK